MAEWIKCSERMPEEGEPVWLFDGRMIWIGTRDYDDGWHYTNCYMNAYFGAGAWETDSAEFDDDYQPTHWQPLPQPPEDAR